MTRAMKDSGIEWIGQIPENWKMLRMKNCVAIRNGGAWGDDASNTVGDCICLRIADFDYNHFKFKDTKDLTIRHYDMKTIQKLKLQHNDILIEKSGGGDKTPVGRSVIFDKCYDAIFANFMDRIRCRNFVFPMYFQYILITFYKNNYTKNYINQTTGIQNLDLTSMLSKEQIYIPPLCEQQKIADYLDKRCEKIDTAIDNQKQIIEKLKEYKQSLITETVTKGLNPNAKMKDSGIEWIGSIPEHWNIRALKFILQNRNEKNNPILTTERLSLSIDKGVTLYAEKTTNLDRFKEDFTQYKIARPGDLVINSMNVITGAEGVSNYFGCVSPAYYVLFSKDMETTKYCDYIFKTSSIKRILFCLGKGILAIERGNDKVNTCRLKVSINDLGRLNFPLPPLSEQKEIAEYLDKKCNQIDEAIKQKEETISKLEEYKKSLIFECVTGKKEVA